MQISGLALFLPHNKVAAPQPKFGNVIEWEQWAGRAVFDSGSTRL